MSWVAVAVVGGSIIGGVLSSQGQQNAASTQADAAKAQQSNLLAAGQQASQQFTPYSQAGQTALSNLGANNAYFNRQFNNQDLQGNLAPNYQFMLNQGQQANTQTSNVGGGGSNVNRANQVFTQNYAANAYQNAFNNFQVQRGNILAANMGQANLGLAGATGSANAQLGTATNVANLGIGSANATAASQIAQGNIWGGAANSIGNIAAYGAMNSGNNLNNQNLSGYTPNEIALGASPGGSYSGSGNFIMPA